MTILPEARQFLLSRFTKNNAYFDTEKKTLNEPFPLHYHNYFEIELIFKGHGTEYINQHKIDIKPGLMYLLFPTDIHEYIINEDVQIYTISFDYPLIPENYLPIFYNNKVENFIMNLTKDRLKLMQGLFENIIDEYTKNDEYSTSNIQHILSIILSHFIRKLPNKEKIEINDNRLLLALNHLLVHFNESPTLQEIAELVGFNPSYFSTIFKQYTQKSYTEYLIELKILHAKKLLKINKMSILEISLSSGFESISNFNRFFKKIVGITPTQYKKAHNITKQTIKAISKSSKDS